MTREMPTSPWSSSAFAQACAALVGLPNFTPHGLLCSQRGFGALRDEPALLLCQGGIEVQHERIGVAAEFGNDKRPPGSLSYSIRQRRHMPKIG